MNEYISKIINNPYRTHAAVGVASLIGGGVIGYLFGRRGYVVGAVESPQLTLDFDVEETLTEMRESRVVIDEEALDVADMPFVPEPVIIDHDAYIQKGTSFVDEHLEPVVEELDPADAVIAQNIFAGNDDDWDYDEEVKSRSDRIPYVIHKDEFYADEKDYTQLTLTYYAGDNIMCDEDEKPVYNHDQIVGPLRFGHGSGDPKTFHVRNDKLKAEYEIVFDPGMFSVDVMGLEIENNERAQDLKHSSLSKFRMD